MVTYFGQFDKNEERTGLCRKISNYELYEGYVQNGRADKFGRLIFDTKYYYIGEFKYGRGFHGIGKLYK